MAWEPGIFHVPQSVRFLGSFSHSPLKAPPPHPSFSPSSLFLFVIYVPTPRSIPSSLCFCGEDVCMYVCDGDRSESNDLKQRQQKCRQLACVLFLSFKQSSWLLLTFSFCEDDTKWREKKGKQTEITVGGRSGRLLLLLLWNAWLFFVLINNRCLHCSV